MLGWLMPGRRGRRLSARFEALVGGGSAVPGPGEIVGLEHEYVVRRAGRRFDFRSLVDRLVESPRGLQPADPFARWLPSGAVVTADGREAEIALPPTPTLPGFSHRVAHLAAAAATRLRSTLPGDLSVEGYSTHISLTMPAGVIDAVADAYARRFAAAMMLLLDGAASPGLLVRPRPGRLELGGEYAAGDDLRAALVFALGSALACLADVESGHASLPALRLRLRYADTRFGWYVDRGAGGSDLYGEGRATTLSTESGGLRSAQQHLEQSWLVAREAAAAHADEEELRLVDELVEGRRPLRIERGGHEDVASHPVPLAEPAASSSPYGRALVPRLRRGFDLAPIMLTWELALFVAADARRRRRAYVAVPGRLLERFVDQLDAGRLDDVIGRYLRLRSSDRLLSAQGRLVVAGLYDGYAIRPSLLAPERSLYRPGEEAA